MRRPDHVGLVAAVLIALSVGVAAQQPPAPGSAADVDAFAKALESCTAATVHTPHPLMKAFIVEHKVTGTENEKCGYRQTMPGKMNMICGLSLAGRKSAAADLRAMANAQSIRGSTSAAGPTWMKECEIEMPDGKRIPAVGKGF